MRRSSQSGNQQPKQHLLSGLQCRKRLVADILFWDGKQWGLATYASLVATATFPISFSNTDYIGIATGVLEDDSQAYIRGILRTHKTTSSCLFRASETGGPAAEYVVIGR